MTNPPIISDEQGRVDSILNSTDAVFEINDNPNTDPRWHEGYAVHSIGKSVVGTLKWGRDNGICK